MSILHRPAKTLTLADLHSIRDIMFGIRHKAHNSVPNQPLHATCRSCQKFEGALTIWLRDHQEEEA